MPLYLNPKKNSQSMSVLVVNGGSSSLRIQLLDADSERRLARGMVERIGAVSSIASLQIGENAAERHGVKAADHTGALRILLNRVTDAAPVDIDAIQVVGHRVVHGGEHFSDSVLIDDAVIASIRDAFDLAPLHNPANLAGILAAKEVLAAVPHVAVFDTAFHQTLPKSAFLYGIPYRLYRRHKIRRYGFHGTSHRYVSRRLYEVAQIAATASRVITCHLGNGCSMAAIRNGASVDTTMGLTPLSGLVMGTRSGDVDPSVIFYLMEKEEMGLAEIHALLNRQSGLLGLSEYESDMRIVCEQAALGDERCQDAIDVFCYRVRGTIGQYMAALNGCDAIVFTGGIGEHAALIRAQVCAELDDLGVVLDFDRNEQEVEGERLISTDGAGVAVWVIPTDEELLIARDAIRVAGV